MSYVCLSSPAWSTGAAFVADLTPLVPALLAHAPRIVLADGCVWADARGLSAPALARQLLDVLRVHAPAGAPPVHAGTALTATAARVAACHPLADTPPAASSLIAIPPGDERLFLATFPIAVLEPGDYLANMLDGLGLDSCGRLAALDASDIEIRLGAEGFALWERARGEDRRWLFTTPLRALPTASLDWTDYALRNADRLLFVCNALLASVCAALVAQGERAREMTLAFALLDRTTYTHPLRSARPTADQKRWLRLVREALENLHLPDAVSGISLRVESVTGNDGAQGDLFDRGFASAEAVEATLAALADDHGELIVSPQATQHPLFERRTTWMPHAPTAVAERHIAAGAAQEPVVPTMTLQLCDPPQPIAVATQPRRDHDIPLRYRDSAGWHALVDIAGPDRVAGGEWDAAFAREYFRCVREDGQLVWMYRTGTHEAPASGRTEAWFLHGWWD